MIKKQVNGVKNSKTMRSKLVSYFLAFSILPLMFLGTGSYLWSISTLDKITDSFSQKLVDRSKDYIDYIFNQIERSVTIVSKSDLTRNAHIISEEEYKLKKLFDDYVQSGSGISNLYLGTIDGRLYSRLNFNFPEENIKNQEWYIKGLSKKTGEFVQVEQHKSLFNNATVITIVKFIRDLNGDSVGVLAADIDVYNVSQIVSNVDVGNNGFIMITDNYNKIIGGPTHYINKLYDQKFCNELNSIGTYSFIKAKYQRVGWNIIGVVPKSETQNEISKIWWIFYSLVLISIIMSIYLATKYATQISQAIQDLKELMNKGASGDLDIQFDLSSKKNSNIEEINQMTTAFNKMIFTLRVLKQSLEVKVVQKTQMAEELKEVNEELNAQQEELIMLNDNLEKSNKNLEQANKEIRETQAQLVQSEKMASLGGLVAGVAHEINTPLGAIHCNIDLFKTIIARLKSNNLIQSDREADELILKLDLANNTNVIASERIMHIVKALRSFARLDEAEFKDANIHDGIDSTLVILASKIKNKVKIEKEYGQLPIVNCYPNQLNQVFMNLLVNAIDSIEGDGNILIKTHATEDDKVYIKIRDNGLGIRPEVINKIFDPGFTTKGVGVGTGLGLSIVFNIIQKHKGKISVKSEVGKGTEFSIELPVNRNIEK